MSSGPSLGVLQKEIIDSFEAMAALDPTDLVGSEVQELVMQAQRIRSLADAWCVQSAAVLDATKEWAVDGAASPTAWVAWRCHVAKARAAAALASARPLRAMPVTERAMLAGAITLDHVRLLAACQAAAPDAFATDEERLVGLASCALFSGFERILRYWRHRHAPDDEEATARQRHLDRRVHCSRTFEGTVVIDALLDPITGEIVARELERLEQQLFEQDWADARERLGDAACQSDLGRTAAQRRADAMRLMAERSAAKPADATEPIVLLNVLAGDESVERMCELSNGTVVTPGEVLQVLPWAHVQRVIFDGPSKVIDVGVRQRLFRGATRTAVQLRDRQCVHPSCDVPFERCEIDHVVRYEHGGLTIQFNGRCKCKRHHRRPSPSP